MSNPARIRNTTDAPLPAAAPNPKESDPMNAQTTHRAIPAAPADAALRGRRTVEVCVVCGHEHVHGHHREVSCPECVGGGRSFLLVHDPTEADR